MEPQLSTPIDSPWPVTTASLLASIEGHAARYGTDTVNEGVLALVRARKAINDARLSCLAAARCEKLNGITRDRLCSIAAAIEGEHDRFPLTILANAGGRKRPPIFPSA